MYEYLREKLFKKKYLSQKFRGLSKISEIWQSSTDKLKLSKKFSLILISRIITQHSNMANPKRQCINDHKKSASIPDSTANDSVVVAMNIS